MSWSKSIVQWEDATRRYFSIVFTWDLYEWARSAQPYLDEKPIIVGGPAVELRPDLVPYWIQIGHSAPGVLARHNPEATRTSRGCPRQCPFCAVPVLEGPLQELGDYEIRPILIDDNFLATSRSHFDKAIDRLKALPWCDFNQGLDARLLTTRAADRLSELRDPLIRLSWDSVNEEAPVRAAIEKLRRGGFRKHSIRVYILIGYNDTPEEALYRLNEIRALGLRPFPMRYRPIKAERKNDHVAAAWTQRELIRYMSYWANFRYTSHIPFEDYEPHKKAAVGRSLF